MFSPKVTIITFHRKSKDDRHYRQQTEITRGQQRGSRWHGITWNCVVKRAGPALSALNSSLEKSRYHRTDESAQGAGFYRSVARRGQTATPFVALPPARHPTRCSLRGREQPLNCSPYRSHTTPPRVLPPCVRWIHLSPPLGWTHRQTGKRISESIKVADSIIQRARPRWHQPPVSGVETQLDPWGDLHFSPPPFPSLQVRSTERWSPFVTW